jgi:hypothetical protein
MIVTKETNDSVYDDRTYWDIHDDGLSFKREEPDQADPSTESEKPIT